MSSKSASHRVFFAFVLLAAFILASLPAQARTIRRPTTSRNSVAVSGDNTLTSLWRFVVSLWLRGTTKEGMSIDPNGNTNHTGTSANPAGDLIDEGTSIDPDGSK
jgi:hypothetical protein